MKIPEKILRAVEGNKSLGKNITHHINERDLITARQWKNKIKPMMQDLQNKVIQQIRNIDGTDWQLSNLARIRGEIDRTIERFDARFMEVIPQGMSETVEEGIEYIDKSARSLNFNPASRVMIPDEIVQTLLPVTRSFTNFWTKGMANKIGTEISLGLMQNESTMKVAQNIKDAFKSSRVMGFNRARTIAETEMNRASAIAEKLRADEIQEVNPDARKIWIDQHKPDARMNHIAVETSSRANPLKMDELFIIPPTKYTLQEEALHPRALNLSAGNTVNCGCVLAIINRTDLEDIPNLEK